MKPLSIMVRAVWDEDANVWWASTSDIHGLAAEAPTLEELNAKVLAMLADLIEANGFDSELPEVPVYFLAERSTRIVNPHRAA